LPEEARKAFLFENIHDSRGAEFTIPVLVGGLAASEEIYSLDFNVTEMKLPIVGKKLYPQPLQLLDQTLAA
jgi:hypothetical protein